MIDFRLCFKGHFGWKVVMGQGVLSQVRRSFLVGPKKVGLGNPENFPKPKFRALKRKTFKNKVKRGLLRCIRKNSYFSRPPFLRFMILEQLIYIKCY